jgi:plastocyanin
MAEPAGLTTTPAEAAPTATLATTAPVPTTSLPATPLGPASSSATVPVPTPPALPSSTATLIPATQPAPSPTLVSAAPTSAPASTASAVDPAPTLAPASKSGGAKVTVRMNNYAFAPQTLTIAPGTTVTWLNTDDTTHTVTADDQRYNSGDMKKGDQFSFTFTKPGLYRYYCVWHGAPGGQAMSGSVTVK